MFTSRAPAVVLCLLIALATRAQPEPTTEPDNTHRVVSFNIRLGSGNDGPDRWELRRDKVVATIRDLDADVVGLQEAEPFQVRELLDALPRYAAVGVHRDDGLLAGEGATILYDRARYTLAATDTFWLSDTPDIAGTNTWGAACNRTCTWARLVDLKTADALTVFNTHFDHQSQPAREKSAALILERMKAHDGPAILIGDLNAGENNPVVAKLVRGGLTDTYRAHHPDAPAGTYTDFDVDSDGGTRKIDYVLTTPGFEIIDAGIDRRKIDGRYPSDHFPVWADLIIDR